MLTVFNVGQGDCYLLNPNLGCSFTTTPLLIDTGPSHRIPPRIPREVSVLLTHSHKDHIGGLAAILKGKQVKGLYIPYYLPEVIKIHSYLSKHARFSIGKVNWNSINRINPKLVSEGDSLCRNHARILNPPRNPRECFGNSIREYSPEDVVHALEILRDYQIDLPRDEIINYETPITQFESNQTVDYRDIARVFVHLFFIGLSSGIQREPREGLSYYLERQIELTSNQASVAFLYNHPKYDKWLFTGDIDEAVFARLLSSGVDISAKYLKVPHHGSRGSLSLQVLKSINPAVAVISHNNGKFGRSKDTHPHNEVIDMLDQEGISAFYTNDVIKGKMTIKHKTTGLKESGLINFI